LTPELEELDAEPDDDPDALGEDEPPQAARAGVTSRPAVSTRAAERAEGRRNGRADSFTRNLRLPGAVDPTTVRAESVRIVRVPLVPPTDGVCGTIGGVSSRMWPGCSARTNARVPRGDCGEHGCVST
jgi:hypothetical protein